ncbi:MAG: hypothetical protein WCF20_15485 [Methylovirgula sp.]
MILLALLLLALGTLLSRWVKVFALIPATVLAWIAAVHIAQLDSLSVLQTLIATFLCGACLQLGYFAGAVLVNQRIAQMRKRAVIAARR